MVVLNAYVKGRPQSQESKDRAWIKRVKEGPWKLGDATQIEGFTDLFNSRLKTATKNPQKSKWKRLIGNKPENYVLTIRRKNFEKKKVPFVYRDMVQLWNQNHADRPFTSLSKRNQQIALWSTYYSTTKGKAELQAKKNKLEKKLNGTFYTNSMEVEQEQ